MNSVLLFIFTFLWGLSPIANPKPGPVSVVQDESQNPVNVLMKDMTKYYVAIFWKGPSWGSDSEARLEERAKESKELRNLVKSGKLVGIVRTTGDARCKLLAFFKTDSKDDAHAISDSILAVKEKILTPELYSVWGSRGMGKELKENMEKGMKPAKHQDYYLGFFTKGKKWTPNVQEDTLKAWASRHAAAVLEWKAKGALKFYGAVDDTGPLRVMGIFTAKSLEEAKQKLAAAPTVKGEWFTAEAFSCTVLDGILP